MGEIEYEAGLDPSISTNASLLARMLTYAPASVVPAVISLANSSIFTRYFTASEFGEYSLFFIAANTARLISTMWISQGIGRYLPAENSPEGRARIKATVMRGVLVVLALEGLVGAVLLGAFRPLSLASGRAFLLPAVAYVMAGSAFDIFGMLLSAEMRAREFVFYRLIDSAGVFLLRLLLVFSFVRMGISALFWSVIASDIILIPFMWARSGLPPVLPAVRSAVSRDSLRSLGSLLRFGVPMTMWYLASIFLDVGDRYVLELLQGPKAVGIYDANYRLVAGSVALVIMPITLTLHPYLMRATGKGDSAEVGRLIGSIIEKMILLGALAVGLAAIFHRDAAIVLLGPEFREGSFVMPVVLAGIVAFNIGTFAHKPFEMAERTGVMVALCVLAAVANLAANFVLIPVLGYAGAAYSTIFAFSLYSLLVGVLGRRMLPWVMDVKRTLLGAGSVSACVGAILALRAFLERRFGYGAGLVAALALGAVLAAVTAVKLAGGKASQAVGKGCPESARSGEC